MGCALKRGRRALKFIPRPGDQPHSLSINPCPDLFHFSVFQNQPIPCLRVWLREAEPPPKVFFRLTETFQVMKSSLKPNPVSERNQLQNLYEYVYVYIHMYMYMSFWGNRRALVNDEKVEARGTLFSSQTFWSMQVAPKGLVKNCNSPEPSL